MSPTAVRTVAAAPPSVVVESKFMQNFRVASAVDPGAGLVSIRNSSGLTEFFSIGTDQAVHNYYPDTATDTGYSSVPIGVQASALGVTVNAQGAIVVFAASATTLMMVTEQPGQTTRWSVPVQLPVPLPANPHLIAAIYTATAGTNSYVALLIQTQSTSPGSTYQLVLGTMVNSQAPTFIKTNIAFSSLNCAWMGATPAAMQFMCADGALVAVSPVTGQGTRLPMRGSFQSLSVVSDVDGQGQAQLYAVLADGNAYRLLQGSSYSWAQLTQGQAFTQIDAEADAGGAIHLLCVGGNATLSHLQPTTQSPTGYGNPTPILANVSTIAMVSNDAGQIEAFAAGTGAGSLNYLAWDAVSTNWEVLQVEVEQGTAVEPFSSYGSDVQLRDASGAPLAQQGVTITANESTRITVNGASYFVDTSRAAYVTTNASGMLNIQQQAGALSVPTLLLTVPGLMPPGDTIAISQDMVTQAPLAALTGPELYAATTYAGQPVLPDAYRTPEQAAAIASAVSQVMGLAETSAPLQAATGAQLRRVRPGVRVVGAADRTRLRLLEPPLAQPRHWRLTTVDGGVVFETMSSSQAQVHLQSRRAASTQVGGFLDFIGDIGDIITGAVQGVVDIVETVVSVVGGAINAAITFIVDGVQYLYETVVSAVEQLFDVVESVFAQVKVFFQTLYEWLAFIFNWTDIVRTAKAMSYTVNQFMGFFEGAVGGIQSYFDQGMDTLQSTITGFFNQAIADVGSSSVGGYADSNEPDDPQVQGALSNNPIFNALIDNANAMTGSGSLARALMLVKSTGSDPYAQIEQTLQSTTTSTTGNSNFTPVQSYFTTLGGAQDDLFSSLLQSMLGVVRDLIQAVLSGLQTIVDQLLQLLQQMIGTFTAALNEDWDVPFLSPLFSYATDGMPMSTVNLISLVMAIPATVLYKAVFGKAPFASDADLTAFEQAWSASTLLQASGLGGGATMSAKKAAAKSAARRKGAAGEALTASTWTGVLPQGVAPVVALLGAVSAYFNAGISAVTDAIPGADKIEPLSICGFVTEVLGQAASCPWFYAAGAIGCSGDSAGYLNWTYANLGVGLDLLYLATGESIPSDVQTVITHLYGNVHLAVAIMASSGQPAETIAANILAVIPEMGKILKFSGIAEATEGISLLVLGLLDAVCLPVSATISTVQTIAAIPPTQEPAPPAQPVPIKVPGVLPAHSTSTFVPLAQGALPC